MPATAMSTISGDFGTLVKIDVPTIPGVPHCDQRHTVTPSYQEIVKRRLSMQHHPVARDVNVLNTMVTSPGLEQLFGLCVIA
jgi:hypothetical protein